MRRLLVPVLSFPHGHRGRRAVHHERRVGGVLLRRRPSTRTSCRFSRRTARSAIAPARSRRCRSSPSRKRARTRGPSPRRSQPGRCRHGLRIRRRALQEREGAERRRDRDHRRVGREGRGRGRREGSPGAGDFSDGWTIGTPDIIVTMPKDVELPATGVIDQQNVLVYAHFDKDMWVKAAEVRPGNPRAVHHMKAWIRPPNSLWMKDAPEGVLYSPPRGAAGTDGLATGRRVVCNRLPAGAGHPGEVQPRRRRAGVRDRQRGEVHRRRLGHRLRGALHGDRQARDGSIVGRHRARRRRRRGSVT